MSTLFLKIISYIYIRECDNTLKINWKNWNWKNFHNLLPYKRLIFSRLHSKDHIEYNDNISTKNQHGC